ncbi:hypothetical protein ABVE25_16105, partial [Xanthomonas euvesicatoria]
RVGLFDKPDDLLGAESALLHVRPLGFTDFIASAGTAQWGQVTTAYQWTAIRSAIVNWRCYFPREANRLSGLSLFGQK